MAKKHGETKKRTSGEMMNKRRGLRGKTDIQKGKLLNWRRNTPFLSLSLEKNSKNGNYSEKLRFLK